MANAEPKCADAVKPAGPRSGSLSKVLAVAAVVLLVALGLWRLSLEGDKPVAYTHQPVGVMSTDCDITVVTAANRHNDARRALHQAEAQLRNVQARMNVFLEHSELWNFNAAPAGEKIQLSPETLAVLLSARRINLLSEGAFDVTILPMIRLWKAAPQTGQPPSDDELAQARAASSWDLISLASDGATKKSPSVEIDLGGIAKGFAVDQALEALKSAGADGGMVNLGGNIRVFGKTPEGLPWTIGVRNPFQSGPDAGVIAQVVLTDEAIATSAHYYRYVRIGDRSYSHIIDPRSGRPAQRAASVTVIARTAMEADGWSTALAVLGPAGMRLLPDGVDAMLIAGDEHSHKVLATQGFSARLVK